MASRLKFGGRPVISEELFERKRCGKHVRIPAARPSDLNSDWLTLGSDAARHHTSGLLAQIQRKIEASPVKPCIVVPPSWYLTACVECRDRSCGRDKQVDPFK